MCTVLPPLTFSRGPSHNLCHPPACPNCSTRVTFFVKRGFRDYMTAEEIVEALMAQEDVLLSEDFPFKYQQGSVTTFLASATVNRGTNIHLIIWPVVAALILVILLLALFARRYR